MNNVVAKIKYLLKNVHPETWVFFVIFLLTRYASNKQYFLLLVIGFIFFIYFTKNILNSLWYLYISTLPFIKAIPLKLIPLYNDMNFGDNSYLLFGDVILFFIIYFLITRRRKVGMFLDKGTIVYTFCLIMFFVSAGISTLYAQYSLTSFYYFVWLGKLILLFIIGKIVFSDHNMVKKTMEILMALILINSVLIVGQYLVSGPLAIAFEDTFNPYGKYSEQNLFRPGGITNDPNISATWTASLLPYVLINTLTISTGVVGSNWIILVILILGLVFTASRAAWIVAFLMSFAIVFYLYKKNKVFIPNLIKKYWRIGLTILIIAIAPAIIGRLSTFQQAFTWQGSGSFRLRQIPIGLRMMQENIFGIGLGMFSHPITSYNLSERFQLPSDLAHNVLVQIGGETGIVGLGFFSLFLYFLIRSKLVKLKKDATLLSISMFVGFISILLLMMAYPWFMHPRISWLFWILAAF